MHTLLFDKVTLQDTQVVVPAFFEIGQILKVPLTVELIVTSVSYISLSSSISGTCLLGLVLSSVWVGLDLAFQVAMVEFDSTCTNHISFDLLQVLAHLS